MNLVERAMALALHYHAGQTRNDGSAYIYHPVTVANLLRIAGFGEEYQAAALLHDTLEDTPVTEAELSPFGKDVLKAVKLLTRPKGMPEEEYVARILEDRLATVVKSADKIHNVLNAVYCRPCGETRSEEETAFARKYVKKAVRYYYGKFNRALDGAIEIAKAAVLSDTVPEWSIPFTQPADLTPYTPEERKERME